MQILVGYRLCYAPAWEWHVSHSEIHNTDVNWHACSLTLLRSANFPDFHTHTHNFLIEQNERFLGTDFKKLASITMHTRWPRRHASSAIEVSQSVCAYNLPSIRRLLQFPLLPRLGHLERTALLMLPIHSHCCLHSNSFLKKNFFALSLASQLQWTLLVPS